jgi:hypothetical protein
MIRFQNSDQIYIYLWIIMFSLGFCLLLINLILKNDRFSLMFIGIGCGIIAYTLLLCFCEPMRSICCKESIFDHHRNLINNVNETIATVSGDEENQIRIIPPEYVDVNNEKDVIIENNIPFAKKIKIVAENIKIL